MDYSQFEIFNDMSMGLPVSIPQMPLTTPFIQIGEYAQWEIGQPMAGVDYPVASLMDAYFDVAQNNVGLPEIFQNYDFNQYLDTTAVNNFMSNSFNTGLSNLTLDPAMTWDYYAMNNDISGEFSNLDYSNYLNDTIASLYDAGDFMNANILDQQQFMLNYCNGFNVNFYDTFFC